MALAPPKGASTCLARIMLISPLGKRVAGIDALRQFPFDLANMVLRKMAQVISVFSPRFLDWLLAIRRIYTAYNSSHGFYPSLIFPTRFTEKMQWRKLFDLNPTYGILCDKLAVREFARERVGQEVLIPLLWSGHDPNAIPFDALEPPYILKSSHACGHTILVKDKALLDETAIRETARAWLAWNHGKAFDEPGYVNVPQVLLVEKLLLNKDGSAPPEHKVFVFDGVAKLIQTVTVSARNRARSTSHHTADWIELPWKFLNPPSGLSLNPPCRLAEIIQIAERLGAGFDHVRVDLYECDDRVYAGEMTIYSHSGLQLITPDSADLVLGAYWRIRLKWLRALWAIFARKREIRRVATVSSLNTRASEREACTQMQESA